LKIVVYIEWVKKITEVPASVIT